MRSVSCCWLSTSLAVSLALPPAASAQEQVTPTVDVTVRGERREPAAASYTRSEVRRIPGAFGDPFRAVETLPGVTPVASGIPFFYVRGAPPGNVGYFLDGVRVPYLFHIGAGPSVVQPAIVERVDLYPGGYPSRFGRVAGGIVAASTTEPWSESHGEGNLRLFDVGGMLESGFDDGRASALAGGRYSYTGALLLLASPELDLDYRDFQARATYALTPRDRLSLFSFGAYDFLAQEQGDEREILFGSEFYRADLRYDRSFDGGHLRSAITLGYDQTNTQFLADDRRNAEDHSIATRTELEAALGTSVLLRAGADAGIDAYDVDGSSYRDPDNPEVLRFEQLFPPRKDYAAGAWLDAVIELTSALQVTPGVRVDLYGSDSTRAFAIDPRASAQLQVVPELRFSAAVGLAHQAPSFVLPLPGIRPTLGDGLQESVQSSAGVELALDSATTAGATGFYNVFTDMTDAIGTMEGGEGAPDFSQRSDGSAYGVELAIRRRLTKRLGGFATYTFSRSLRRLIGQDGLDGQQRASAFDRPHVANAAISYDLGRGSRAG
ncbi:MAG TPA: TonB-dependent receptor, partial [Polyangiales bacterium]|nr:TonB-dependent receptor [Polyangiales bacterium]